MAEVVLSELEDVLPLKYPESPEAFIQLFRLPDNHLFQPGTCFNAHRSGSLVALTYIPEDSGGRGKVTMLGRAVIDTFDPEQKFFAGAEKKLGREIVVEKMLSPTLLVLKR